MRRSWNGLAAAFALPLGLLAGALPERAVGQTDLVYPAPVRSFEVEGGYRFYERDDAEDESFYRVTYSGQLLRSKGEPFTSIEHVDLTVPPPADALGDRNDLELRLENTSGTLGGDLFEGDLARPLNLRGLTDAGLRGAAYLATDLDGNRVKAAVGIESRPFRVPGFSQLGAANWLILGVMAERNDATDSTTADDTYAIGTAKLFIGKAFGMHERPDRDAIARQIAAEFLRKAPTRDDAVALVTSISKIPASQRSEMQAWIVTLVRGTAPDGVWEDEVMAFTDGIAQAVSEQPTVAVYLEASGWYADTSVPGEPRRRGLVSLTADYWPLRTREDVILRISYDWGFERLQPNVRVNQVTVSAVLQF